MVASPRGSLSRGLHHARRNRGEGFCAFNGLVIAAKSALAEGARSVLIIDLDAHCGGGTHSLVTDDPRMWQLDVSVDDFDDYTPAERTTLDHVNSSEEYLPTIGQRLEAFASSKQAFGLCISNAGMDPFEGCDTGGLAGVDMTTLAPVARGRPCAATA